MLNGRTYVCTSPSIAVAIQRASSTLDFDAMVGQVFPRMVGADAYTSHLVQDPKAREEGRRNLPNKAHDIINPPLGPQRHTELAQAQLGYLSGYVNARKEGQEIDLFHNLSRELTGATMNTFFGPLNPFATNPDLVNKLWDWDDGLVGYMVGVLPHITVRKAHLGLEAVVEGFRKYTENGLYDQAAPFLKTRYELHKAEGLSPAQHARLETGLAFGFNINAGITTFWVVNNILSRPDLLEEVREEIYENAYEAPGVIRASKLRETCPLFSSVWRETLRFIAPMTSARVVLEDTLLSDQYLLRKGSVVQIAGGILHSDADLWGPDVKSFNPRRFYYNRNGTKTAADGEVVDSKANTVHAAAFRAFGGGTSLCPGRHFAETEITTLAAVLVMAFDMQPADSVEWDPPRDEKRFPIGVTKPLRDVRVKVTRRKGFEDVKWVLKV